VLRVAKLKKIKIKMVVARGWEEEEMGCHAAINTEFQFCNMKTFWK
jgi:hypothetical protein